MEIVEGIGSLLDAIRAFGEAPTISLLVALLMASVAGNAWWVIRLSKGDLVSGSREQKLEATIKEREATIKEREATIRALEREQDVLEERVAAVARQGAEASGRTRSTAEDALGLVRSMIDAGWAPPAMSHRRSHASPPPSGDGVP